MDQAPLVDELIADGLRFVERFVADGNPVRAAFWARAEDENSAALCVATDLVESKGTTATYRCVQASLRKLGQLWVLGSDIRIVSPTSPLARDILSLMERYPGPTPTRINRRVLGSSVYEQVYIYPQQLYTHSKVDPMTTNDVAQEITRLMNRGAGVLQPSRVTLKDGTHFSGVPFGLIVGSSRAVEAQFIADGESAPRVVRLDEINSIA